MGTPISLGIIFGVHVRIDVTLFIRRRLHRRRRHGRAAACQARSIRRRSSILLFFCIYLHEMGHAFGGWLFGIRTLDVTLTFFGGYARLAGVPRGSFQQIVVSFAGPAANLLIAGVLYWYAANTFNESYLVRSLAYANLFLGLFNLLPGFPLDGGKIAAAILSNFMPMSRARVATGYIGVVIGFGLVVWGLQGGGFGFNAMSACCSSSRPLKKFKPHGSGRF